MKILFLAIPLAVWNSLDTFEQKAIQTDTVYPRLLSRLLSTSNVFESVTEFHNYKDTEEKELFAITFISECVMSKGNKNIFNQMLNDFLENLDDLKDLDEVGFGYLEEFKHIIKNFESKSRNKRAH